MKSLTLVISLAVITVILFAGCSVQQSQQSGGNSKNMNNGRNPNADLGTDFGLSGQVIVTFADTNKMALVDSGTLSVGGVVDVGNNPQDVIFSKDGARILAVMSGSFDLSEKNSESTQSALMENSFWTWNATTHRIMGKSSISTGDGIEHPVGLGIDSTSSRLYISNMSSDTLLIRNLEGEQNLINSIPVGKGPRKVLVSEDDKYIITINTDLENRSETDSVSIIHLLSQEEVARVDVGDTPWGGCIHPDNEKFYVSVSGSDEVKEILIKEGKVGKTYSVGKSPRGIVLSDDGQTLFVASYDEDSLIPLSLLNGEAGEPVKVGKGPVEVASSLQSVQILFIGNTKSNSLTVYNTSQGKIIDTIKLDGSPTQIAIWTGAIPATKAPAPQSESALRDMLSPTGTMKVDPSSSTPSESGE